MIGNYPYLPHPLEDDVQAFAADIEDQYSRCNMTPTEYHIALGKAMAYVECRYSLGQLSDEEAHELLCSIDELI